jgi:pimeloyl-ACP methyl ester carboxylesterase
MQNVILIHGALGTGKQLEPLRAPLAPRGDLHFLELEGHGGTMATADRYSMARFAENVRAYMKRNRIERADLFGYSMGGYVALLLAAESPNLVASVATLATKLAWSPEVAVRETKRLDPEMIRAKVPAFAAQLEERHAGAGGWEHVLARTARLMTDLGEHSSLDPAALTRIEAPVRLMVGDKDAVVSVAETEAAASAIPRGQLAVLPGTPHPFEQVRVPLVAAMLDGFPPP